MNVKKLFGARYLSLRDLRGKILTSKIMSVEAAKLGMKGNSATDKLIIGLENVAKRLVVNSTNAGVLMEKLGEETDEWLGASITIEVGQVAYGAEMVDSIVVVKVDPPAGGIKKGVKGGKKQAVTGL